MLYAEEHVFIGPNMFLCLQENKTVANVSLFYYIVTTLNTFYFQANSENEWIKKCKGTIAWKSV